MKRFATGLAALMIFGALSFGTAEAAENSAAIENPFDSQELKAPPWFEPPPPRHRNHYEPPHHRHEPPHFGRRPNDFDPPHHRHEPPPPPRHRW